MASAASFSNSDWDFELHYAGGKSPDGEEALYIRRYKGNATDVRIPTEFEKHKIVEVGPEAFHEANRVLSVFVPAGIKWLSYQAFSSCANLKEVIIESAATKISNAFYDCGRLECLRAPKLNYESLDKSLRVPACVGFAELSAEGGEYDTESAKPFMRYLKTQSKKFYSLFVCRPLLAKYMVESSAIPAEDVSTLQEEAEQEGHPEIADLLMSYSPAEKKVSSRVAPKEKKETPAQICEAVLARLENGDSSKIGELEPIADKINPISRVIMLETASACCDVDALKSLFKVFKSFEFTSNALAICFLLGKTDNAAFLIKKRANFDGEYRKEDIGFKGDTSKKRDKREIKYFGFALSGYYRKDKATLSSILSEGVEGAHYAALFAPIDEVSIQDPARRLRSDEFTKWSSARVPRTGSYISAYDGRSVENVVSVIEKLTEQSLLNDKQISALALASAFFGHTVEAGRIASLLSEDIQPVSIAVRRFGRRVLISEPLDLLVPRCSLDVAKFVVSTVAAAKLTDWLADNWSSGFFEHNNGVVEALVPFMTAETHSILATCKYLARSGNIACLEKLKAQGGLGSGCIKPCIEAAQDSGETETVAWLLANLDKTTHGSHAYSS